MTERVYIDSTKREFLNLLRGASILRVMMAHLGLSWFYPPYSEYLAILLPIFFFVSGAVSFNSSLKPTATHVYAINRYITLVLPFLVFSIPFIGWATYQQSWTGVSDLVSLAIAWPPMTLYPFPMQQLWFINVLLMLFLISYPIFLIAKRKPVILWLAFACSLIYIPVAESLKLWTLFNQVEWIKTLDLSMQLHQTLSLACYFLFGAIYCRFDQNRQRVHLVGLVVSFALACWLFTHFDPASNLRLTLFERGSFFSASSFACIFAVILSMRSIILVCKSLPPIHWLFSTMSRHSYSLFLIHTPIMFAVEHAGLDNLGDKPALALVKMILVIALSTVLAPYLSSVTKQCTERLRLNVQQAPLTNTKGTI